MAAPPKSRGNAGKGRAKGTPNRVTKALKEMILGALDRAGGETYLTAQAEANPAAFLRLLGQVLPTTLANDDGQPLVVKIVRFGDPTPE